MGDEDTTNWRLKQIETKTDKLESTDEKISTKVTVMEGDVKIILDATKSLKADVNTIKEKALKNYERIVIAIVLFILTNTLGIIWSMFFK